MDDGYAQTSTEHFLSDEPIILAIIYSPLYKLYAESQTQQQNQTRMVNCNQVSKQLSHPGTKVLRDLMTQ